MRHPLSAAERQQIAALGNAGASDQEIAAFLKRDRATVAKVLAKEVRRSGATGRRSAGAAAAAARVLAYRGLCPRWVKAEPFSRAWFRQCDSSFKAGFISGRAREQQERKRQGKCGELCASSRIDSCGQQI